MERNLKCYAWKTGDQWEAICVSLDIAVQGRSFEEVRDSLRNCIIEYVGSVMEMPAEDQMRLMNRRAPLFVRLGLAFSFALAGIRDMFNGDGGGSYSFPVDTNTAHA